MKFSAKKEPAFLLPLLLPAILAFLVALWFVFSIPNLISALALLASLALFYAIYYFWNNTYYEVKKEHLYYRSVSVKGRIPIKKINRIEKSDYPARGNRPALALTGITVSYSAGQKIFIAPQDTEGLITALRAVNRRIKVVQ